MLLLLFHQRNCFGKCFWKYIQKNQSFQNEGTEKCNGSHRVAEKEAWSSRNHVRCSCNWHAGRLAATCLLYYNLFWVKNKMQGGRGEMEAKTHKAARVNHLEHVCVLIKAWGSSRMRGFSMWEGFVWQIMKVRTLSTQLVIPCGGTTRNSCQQMAWKGLLLTGDEREGQHWHGAPVISSHCQADLPRCLAQSGQEGLLYLRCWRRERDQAHLACQVYWVNSSGSYVTTNMAGLFSVIYAPFVVSSHKRRHPSSFLYWPTYAD